MRATNRRPAAMLAAIWIAQGATAAAQQSADPFGSFRHDNTQPIEITADALEVRDADSMAVFSGAVVAGQGELRLTAEVLSVWYVRDGGGGESGQIERLRAEGDVFLSSGTETATGDWAEYAVTEGVVTMGGGVTLAQGENAIRGDRLRVDLNTGVGRVEGGRVQSVFNPAEAQGQ